MDERDAQPEALVGTPGPVPASETAEGEVMSISPIGAPLGGDTLRRQVALSMAIDARARDAESEDVVDVAARYDDFLRGDDASS